MTHPLPTDAPSGQVTDDAARLRQCLKCRAKFRSEWAGERICSRCKSTVVWRRGATLKSQSVGTRR